MSNYRWGWACWGLARERGRLRLTWASYTLRAWPQLSIRPPSRARVRFLRDLFGFIGNLAHDVIRSSSLHDLLDIWDRVSFDDRERGRIGADLLVLLAVHLDPARASRVAALADQVKRFRMREALSQFLKPLVHFTEQRLVHADPAFP